MKKIAIIGGGAAGVFGAIWAKVTNPDAQVILFEKSKVLLSKVKISGGGRCNVTHSCFDPKKLIRYYPRGGKELHLPFTQFQPKDTIIWFNKRGVNLKTEKDGRIFPTTDNSQTIIDALVHELKRLNIEIQFLANIADIESDFTITFKSGEKRFFDALLLATGSSPEGYKWASKFGHHIVTPVPSLFTFNILDFALASLSGIAVPDALVTLPECGLSQRGPLLITHFGFSGPAILRLSAWAARFLHEKNYETLVTINFLPDPQARLPKNLQKQLKNGPVQTYQIRGKTTHKEEFVTAGGVDLTQVNMQTLESKLRPHLFFAGEILNIDGLTGGFNFQNAWTTSYLAGTHI